MKMSGIGAQFADSHVAVLVSIVVDSKKKTPASFSSTTPSRTTLCRTSGYVCHLDSSRELRIPPHSHSELKKREIHHIKQHSCIVR